MATLVLTAVGTAIGGPIGGMVGAAIGGAVDRSVFAAKPREGPRLSDLRIQTSTYGSAIPRLYGRVRVAGTVVWATDLKEAKTTSGGKGQQKTTSYSYSASFAVALSSRRAGRVARIWADGKLLRGGAGDFKTRTGFRWFAGDEDQGVDPLIASAVGIGQCPAYRGLALAVFEDMALGDYGNRIPALTFEVIADEGAIDVGAVARDLLPPPFAADSAVALTGYAAEGASIAAALSPLVTLGGLTRTGAPQAPVLAAAGGGGAVPIAAAAPVRVERLASDRRPGAVTLRHYDPARDYQAGAQRAVVSDGGVDRGDEGERIDVPAAIDAAGARRAARRIARARRGESVRLSLRAGMAALALRPGDAVAVGDVAGDWRLAECEIDAGGAALTLAPAIGGERIANGGGVDPGAPVFEPDWPVPPTHWRFVDLPAIVAPRGDGAIHVVAAGTAPGWRGADVAIEGGWNEAGQAGSGSRA